MAAPAREDHFTESEALRHRGRAEDRPGFRDLCEATFHTGARAPASSQRSTSGTSTRTRDDCHPRRQDRARIVSLTSEAVQFFKRVADGRSRATFCYRARTASVGESRNSTAR